jgi:glucokinase-like ROK family protein
MLSLTSERAGTSSGGMSVTTSDVTGQTRGRSVTLPESLLDLIRVRGTATRAELVEETGWGRTVLTQRLTELMEIGLVSEAGTGRSTGGRAPREVRFRREAAAVVGVNLGATSIDIAVTDLAGEPLATYEESWDIAQGPEATLDRLTPLIEQIIAQSPVPQADIVGIGVGLPGPVEFATGRTVSPPIMPGWNNYPVRDRLAAHFGVAVVVDNDVNTMAIGEQRAGLARGVDDFVFVKVGTGIGAGIFSNGMLHRGSDGAAGDIGHIAVEGGSAVLCRCGRYGCLEAYAGGAALARQAQEAGESGQSRYLADLLKTADRPLTAADVTSGASAGDPACLQLLRQAAWRLGQAMAGCVNFFNPALIVFGGGVSRAGDLLLPGIRQAVLELSLPLATRNLRIDITRLGDTSGTIGAAFAVIDQLLRADRFAWWADRYHAGRSIPPARPPGRTTSRRLAAS